MAHQQLQLTGAALQVRAGFWCLFEHVLRGRWLREHITSVNHQFSTLRTGLGHMLDLMWGIG